MGTTAGGGAIVDVSNVCWSAEIPPADPGRARPNLDRLDAVVRAWRAAHGAAAPLRLVADRSLPHYLSAADRRRWPRLAREFEITSVPVADELILREAEANGWTVLSRDRFLDHRPEHPWIERHPERFLSWRWGAGGLAFVPSGVRPEARQVVSRMRELKHLQCAGLDPRRHRDVLRTRWRCATGGCAQGEHPLGELLLWPAVDRAGGAHCPVCESTLVPLGPRALVRQLVIGTADGGAELLRLPIEADAPLLLGRGRSPGVDLESMPEPPPRIGRLSRQHLLLSLDGSGGLSAVDLGATNGTTLVRMRADATRLLPDRPVVVGGTDHLLLAGVLRVYLSGRRFLAAGETGALETGQEPPAHATAGATKVTEIGPAAGGEDSPCS
ncbi:hypothetical protein [Dactylosporangium sp. CA-139066]|uniref:hypothetical protein n=1 Tax=Dactylosporangium sp. CA-139066 TaxID=3239930 RepID=UPI003D90E332